MRNENIKIKQKLIVRVLDYTRYLTFANAQVAGL